jgi:DNA topoisomerase-1
MALDGEADAVATARRAGLVYVHEGDPGYRRERTPEGFVYADPRGRKVKDPKVLGRIAGLAIPPAWEAVWVCALPEGHLQATGRDARGRKQYRYHPGWRSARDETKFERMAAFGRSLPQIRAAVDADLRRRELSHDKVVAMVVRLLETTLIRVGNEAYARDNKSFGLTTLRSRHVKAEGAAVRFEFRGKSGILHRTGVRDRRLVRLIRTLQALPGQRLFQYRDEEGRLRPVGSHDVNAYLRTVAGEGFTAKDFRTFAATVAAAKALALQEAPDCARTAARVQALCVKATAGLLGNTPAVCRKAYIHPAVFDAYLGASLPSALRDADGAACEAEVLAFLEALETPFALGAGPCPGARRPPRSPAPEPET